MSTVADLDVDLSTADIMPAALASIRGEDNRLQLPTCSAVAVLLVDGLGWNLLRRHAHLAPTLSALAGAPVSSSFPSTTAAGLSSLALGLPSGRHGITGYTSPWGPDDGMNWLTWTSCMTGADLRPTAVPEQVQPEPTIFERARDAGLHPTVVSSRSFVGSGLTRAIFRGATYVPTVTAADTVSGVLQSLRPGALVYAYFNELDRVGHAHGTRSASWRTQLQVLDHTMSLLLDQLPSGATALITGDHGMVDVPEHAKVDLDADPRLTEDIVAITGDCRNRHLTVPAELVEFVQHRWRDALGDGFTVRTRQEAIDSGLFGAEVAPQFRDRIGDLMVTATGDGALVRRTLEPGEAELVGFHGADTEDERLVPLLRYRS